MKTPLTTEAKKAVAQALEQALADSFALYFKTHSYHWNVTGPQFFSLHTLFEQQYTELWQALDELAERIRTLGEAAPESPIKLAEKSTIGNTYEQKANNMVKDLAFAQEIVLKSLENALLISQKHEDEVSIGMLTMRLEIHEKAHWMLASSVEK